MATNAVHIVFNSGAGTAAHAGFDPAALRGRLAELGYAVESVERPGASLEEKLDAARRSDAPILLAAGGDGTATAVAGLAVETGRTLALLPLGTANLLARDLGLPLDPEEWFAALPEMVPRRIDVGEVNGRIFLHKVVVGAVPGLAAARERLRGRTDLGAKLRFMLYLVRRLSRLRRFAAEIARGNETPHIERVQSIAVANNSYDEAPGRIFARSRLDRGTLSLYLLHHLGVIDALRLAVEMMLGAWRDDDELEVADVKSATVRTRWRKIRAMIDGEVELLNGPLRFSIRPLALSVLAPVPVSRVEEVEHISEQAQTAEV